MKLQEIKFNMNDIVMAKNDFGDDFKVRIVNVFCDCDNGKIYYEIEPLEFKSFTREVTKDQLYTINQ